MSSLYVKNVGSCGDIQIANPDPNPNRPSVGFPFVYCESSVDQYNGKQFHSGFMRRSARNLIDTEGIERNNHHFPLERISFSRRPFVEIFERFQSENGKLPPTR